MANNELDEMFDIAAPNMVPLSEIIPDKYLGRIPEGAKDIPVTDAYKGGKIEWLPGPILRILAPDETIELLVGTFPDGGVVQEAMYVDENDGAAPKDKATWGEIWVYGPGKVMVAQALIVAPFGERPVTEEGAPPEK